VSVRQYKFISSFQIQKFCTNWPDDARTGTGYVSEELKYENDSKDSEEDSDKGVLEKDTGGRTLVFKRNNDTKKIPTKKIQKTKESKDVKGKKKSSKPPRPSTVDNSSNDSDISRHPRPSTVVHESDESDSSTRRRLAGWLAGDRKKKVI
jgi:hypothetical protein